VSKSSKAATSDGKLPVDVAHLKKRFLKVVEMEDDEDEK